MNEKHVGVIVRDRRKRLKLTQADVAKLAGVRQDTVSKLEMNAGKTKVETLFKVFNSLGLEFQILNQADVSKDAQW